MSEVNFKKVRRACYFAYLSMSSIFVLPPMLFVTFNEFYNVSFALLGTLVLINFCTQMAIDLFFTFFSKIFNLKIISKIMPLLTSSGLLLYAILPTAFPDYTFVGLIIGTVLFSAASGLCECILSPMIASCPSETPEKDMSILHSLYGWGVVGTVLLSAGYFAVFSTKNWQYLVLFFAILPLISSFLFFTTHLPEMKSEEVKKEDKSNRGVGLLLCALCIFLGSAAENTMTNWISSFTEIALNLEKSVGDVLGLALFAFLLAITRIVYAKFTPDISKTLIISMLCAAVCYLIVGLSTNMIISLIACILIGVFTSLLWPGTLILMENKIPSVGVTAYALMASFGDLGASIAPQTMGIIVDNVSVSSWAINMSESLGITSTELAMKLGMSITAIFPILGAIVVFIIIKKFSSKTKKQLINN